MNVTVSIVNKGVGPALVRQTELSLFDETIKDYLTTYDRLKDSIASDFIGLSLNPTFEGVISPQEEIQLYSLDLDVSSVMEIGRYNFIPSHNICYCSIYDDCWILKDQVSHEIDEDCSA